MNKLSNSQLKTFLEFSGYYNDVAQLNYILNYVKCINLYSLQRFSRDLLSFCTHKDPFLSLPHNQGSCQKTHPQKGLHQGIYTYIGLYTKVYIYIARLIPPCATRNQEAVAIFLPRCRSATHNAAPAAHNAAPAAQQWHVGTVVTRSDYVTN